mmetsp:Transcript_17769/g.32158  ORF Transcript_17769/g.32158 Transcript_17769/m.32158 type:complete len:208 (+) Transcript_17769:1181-1804(+)
MHPPPLRDLIDVKGEARSLEIVPVLDEIPPPLVARNLVGNVEILVQLERNGAVRIGSLHRPAESVHLVLTEVHARHQEHIERKFRPPPRLGGTCRRQRPTPCLLSAGVVTAAAATVGIAVVGHVRDGARHEADVPHRQHEQRGAHDPRRDHGPPREDALLSRAGYPHDDSFARGRYILCGDEASVLGGCRSLLLPSALEWKPRPAIT